jgi:hypothetical protein
MTTQINPAKDMRVDLMGPTVEFLTRVRSRRAVASLSARTKAENKN